MSALTSSRPTVRIATVTVTAARTETSTFHAPTRRPATRAKSGSWATANSSADEPSATAMTTTARADVTARSPVSTVVIDPKR